MEEQQLKEIFRQALLEILEERQDLAEKWFREALEEVALLRAIQEGESTLPVTRDAVFDVLNAVE